MAEPTGQFPPQGTFTITGQREDHRPGPTGQFTNGVVVTFRTGHGDTGSIFVPHGNYEANHVNGLIKAYVAEMAKLRALANGG